MTDLSVGRKKENMESWDILNRNGKPTGRTVSRMCPILRRGEYHLVVHIWTVDGRGNVLIQRRSDQKPLMPGEWAATGGAAVSGEASRFAACRELKEELGITKARDELVYVTRMVRRNSLVDIYLTFTDCDPADLVLQEDEVAEVKWVSTKELADMVSRGEFHNYGKEYFEKLFAAFETKGKVTVK